MRYVKFCLAILVAAQLVPAGPVHGFTAAVEGEGGPSATRPSPRKSPAQDLFLAVNLARGKKKVSYLGVMVSPVSDLLRKHLKLQDGVGFLIEFVEPESPAARGGVRKDDILTRLGDQILVNVSQLRTLIRMRDPGTTVELGLIREGKPVTVKVEVSEKDIPVPDRPEVRWPHSTDDVFIVRPGDTLKAPPWRYTMRVRDSEGREIFRWPPELEKKLKEMQEKISKRIESATRQIGADSEEVEKKLEKLGEEIRKQVESEIDRILEKEEMKRKLDRLPGVIRSRVRAVIKGGRVSGDGMRAEMRTSQISIFDGEHKLTWTVSDGEKHLTLADKGGKVIYAGRALTAEQRKKLSPEIRSMLENLEKNLSVEEGEIIWRSMRPGRMLRAERIEIRTNPSRSPTPK